MVLHTRYYVLRGNRSTLYVIRGTLQEVLCCLIKLNPQSKERYIQKLGVTLRGPLCVLCGKKHNYDQYYSED